MQFEKGDFHSIYDIKEKLGHGHFAEVKRCISKIDTTEYATKFIRKRSRFDNKQVGMSEDEIEREAKILQLLDHQNIIKLHSCYDLKKNVALVLELVSGGELFNYISESEKLSEEEASEFIEQILLGVNHMHNKKVVHLDLKPENVMIEDLTERKIKLIDFGLARHIKNKSTLIELQGTAEFLAPEVINYDPVSYSTDMWAIGVITYIMLTGVSPFSGEDQIATFQNIVNCRLEFEDEICGEMTDMARMFIKALLVVNPNKRATAADILEHSWIKKEIANVVRRRSSIITRDRLQSLKHYVICPSPTGSGNSSPKSVQKFTELYEEDFDEPKTPIEKTRNDSHPNIPIDLSIFNSTLTKPNKSNKSNNYISPKTNNTSNPKSENIDLPTPQISKSKSSKKSLFKSHESNSSNPSSTNKKKKPSDIQLKQDEPAKLSGVNSVMKKLNDKFESLFDTSTPSSSTLSSITVKNNGYGTINKKDTITAPSTPFSSTLTKERKGSLKNSLKISTNEMFGFDFTTFMRNNNVSITNNNDNNHPQSQSTSPAIKLKNSRSSQSKLGTTSSGNHSNFSGPICNSSITNNGSNTNNNNIQPHITSAATSPTAVKKSYHLFRYLSAIQKKN